jgi:hypothetical protein
MLTDAKLNVLVPHAAARAGVVNFGNPVLVHEFVEAAFLRAEAVFPLRAPRFDSFVARGVLALT